MNTNAPVLRRSGLADKISKALADQLERIVQLLRRRSGPVAGLNTHEGSARERGSPPGVLNAEQTERFERSRRADHTTAV